MDKFNRLLIFLFMLIGTALTLTGQTGGDVSLSMDILGWSDEGHFAWIETVKEGGREQNILKVVDLVTDSIVYSEGFSAGGQQAVLNRYGIEAGKKGTPQQGSRLVHQGTLYDIELFSESDRVNIRLKNINGGTYKEVNTAPLGGDEMEIRGSVISPFEKRAALVFLRKGEGHGEYMVMGAHLTLGFRAVPLEQEPLIEAVLNGQYYICRLILEKGTDPDSVGDDRGYPPLLLAARTGNWDIARLLLDYGARGDLKDGEGSSPADYARRAGEGELADKMEKAK
ncbi:MAG: ankyrin repeat domain-containing protein [Spirochaetales bacterium]|nr:ankyrin repeat domain-containing protein [Spirochaetales bacterium]